nr:hypothetical protein [Vibrio mimicus]
MVKIIDFYSENHKILKIKNIVTIFLLGVLVFNLYLLFSFVFINYKYLFHSDSAVINIISQEALTKGKLILTDWYYANGDIWLAFGPIVIAPLLLLFDNGYILHAVASVIYTIILLYSTWMLLSLIKLDYVQKLLILCVITSGISDIVTEALYGQFAYSIIVISLILISHLSILTACSNSIQQFKQSTYFLAIFIIFIILTWSNPSRSLVTYLFPIIATLFIRRIKNKRLSSEFNNNDIRLIGTALLGFVLGSIIYLYTLNDVLMVSGVKPTWQNYSKTVESASTSIYSWITVSHGWFKEDGDIISISSIVDIISIMFGIFVLIYPMKFYIKNITAYDETTDKLVFLSGVYTYSATYIFFLMIFTTLHQNSYAETARYYVPTFTYGIIITSIIIFKTKFNTNRALSLTKIFLCCSMVVISITSGYRNFVLAPQKDKYVGSFENTLELINFLDKNGLKYGFSDYWTAGKITVLSDFSAVVRQIHIVNGEPIPMRWLSSSDWYIWRKENAINKSFILFENDESYKNFDLSKFEIKVSDNNYTYKISKVLDYIVLILEGDITKLYPNWDPYVYNPYKIVPEEKSLRTIGKFDEKKQSIISNIGNDGALYYGPYKELAKGRYRISFHIKSNTTEDSGHVDVVSTMKHSFKLYAKESIVGVKGSRIIHLDFDVDENGHFFEFRVFSTGKSDVQFLGLELMRIK